MARGAKPGERRGGRQKGTPNKETLAKRAGKLDEHKAMLERRRQAEKRASTEEVLSLRTMRQAIQYHVSMAASAQQAPEPDREAIALHLRRASDIAKNLAPYEAARLSTVTVTGAEDGAPIKIESLTEAQMDILIARLIAGMAATSTLR